MKMKNLKNNWFFEKKLERVRKVLEKLKENKKIRDFLQISTGLKRQKVDFYIISINGRYVIRPISIKTSNKNFKRKTVRISLFESEGSIRNKILQAIKES